MTPKEELIATMNLARRLHLQALVPQAKAQRATQRGMVLVNEPLFPGYLLVRTAQDEPLEAISYVNGLSNLGHFGTRCVSDKVIRKSVAAQFRCKADLVPTLACAPQGCVGARGGELART